MQVPYWCVLIGSLVLGLILGWSFADGWGASQWGPLAAWFSGIATLAAVGVAVYQTHLAREDTKQARLDGDERLRVEQERHDDQMATQQRLFQAQLVSTLVQELDAHSSYLGLMMNILNDLKSVRRRDNDVADLQAHLDRCVLHDIDLNKATVATSYFLVDAESRDAIGSAVHVVRNSHNAVVDLARGVISHSGMVFVRQYDEAYEIYIGMDDAMNHLVDVTRQRVANLPPL